MAEIVFFGHFVIAVFIFLVDIAMKSRVCSSSRTQLLLFNSQKAELSRSAVQPPMQSEQPSSAEQPAMQCSQCDTILCQSEQCSFYNKDGTYCRLHPGKNTTRDAMPRIGVVQPDFPAVLLTGDYNLSEAIWRAFLMNNLPNEVKDRVRVLTARPKT